MLGGTPQLVLWLVAMVLEATGPSVRYATPGLGTSGLDSWESSGAHRSERSGRRPAVHRRRAAAGSDTNTLGP
ncbi:MAG: hypothetical protein H7146_03825 [Burkholderiaceae bacterium]|nr:hypothetical protein [Microbacteriaceae bacterium]